MHPLNSNLDFAENEGRFRERWTFSNADIIMGDMDLPGVKSGNYRPS